MKKLIKISVAFVLVAFVILLVNNKITIGILKQGAQQVKSKNVLSELRNEKSNSIIKDNRIFSENSIYVINLWGARCKPCIKEMPALNFLFEKYNKKSVKFIALSKFNDDSIRFSKIGVDYKFKKFYHEGKLFDFFQNLNPSKRKIIPITIVINKQGNIEYFFEGSSKQNIQLIDLYLSKE